MPQPHTFRCPFEMRGEQEGTIIRATLGESREERLRTIRAAYEEFHARHESPAIRFILDPALWQEFTDLRALRLGLVPFQTELLAVDLDLSLYPFLPYQSGGKSKDELLGDALANPTHHWAARALATGIRESGVALERAEDIADWLRNRFQGASARGQAFPSFRILGPVDSGPDSTGEIPLLEFAPPQVIQLWCQSLPNPAQNTNKLSVVLGPFYPQGTGRHSESVEIVVTREADIMRVPPRQWEQIRLRSNAALCDHGLAVEAPRGFVPPLGVWVPGE